MIKDLWTDNDPLVGQWVSGRDVTSNLPQSGTVTHVMHLYYQDGSVRGIDRVRIEGDATSAHRRSIVFI